MTTTTTHAHLTRARGHLYDAQKAALDTLDTRSPACLADSRATRAVELVELIGLRLGRQISVRSDQERHRPAKSEVERLLAGTALAQRLWGWKPRYSLEAGIDETIAWVRSHIDRFRVDAYVT